MLLSFLGFFSMGVEHVTLLLLEWLWYLVSRSRQTACKQKCCVPVHVCAHTNTHTTIWGRYLSSEAARFFHALAILIEKWHKNLPCAVTDTDWYSVFGCDCVCSQVSLGYSAFRTCVSSPTLLLSTKPWGKCLTSPACLRLSLQS